MERKKLLVTLGALAGGAAVVVFMLQRGHDRARQTPAWNDPQQPVEGTAGQPSADAPALAPSPAAAWNAVRPGSARLQAGAVIRRTYAATLVDDPESLVR